MREILFRGKATSDYSLNGEKGFWVYGDLIHYKDGEVYIMEQDEGNWDVTHDATRVIPETVSQFTGLLDKHGRKIFEGDVFNLGDMNILYLVVWHDAGFKGKQIRSTSYVGLDYWKDRIEVIGNIHDNPELLT